MITFSRPPLALLLFLLAGCFSCQSQPSSGPLQVDEEQWRASYPNWPVDSLISLFDQFPNGAEISMAALVDDSMSYLGVRRHGDSLVVFDNQHRVYEIGSISKVLTSSMAAQLSNKSKLDLDAPIDSYLSFNLANETSVTARQLANHTSGLPRMPSNIMMYAVTHPNNPYKTYDAQKLQTYLSQKAKLDNTPGTTYTYSNLGAGFLGYVLTQIEETSYENLLQRQICQPLDMEHTTTNRTQVQNLLAPGLKANGKPTPNWDLNVLVGAGGILSCAEDMGNFMVSQLDTTNSDWQLQQQKTFSVSDDMDLAMAWHILNTRSGHEWHWHNGGTGGYRTSLTIDLKHQTGSLVFTNVSASHPAAQLVDQLNYALLRKLLGE
jgi:CubicO group peptidase (beta-lactamase class C family)